MPISFLLQPPCTSHSIILLDYILFFYFFILDARLDAAVKRKSVNYAQAKWVWKIVFFLYTWNATRYVGASSSLSQNHRVSQVLQQLFTCTEACMNGGFSRIRWQGDFSSCTVIHTHSLCAYDNRSSDNKKRIFYTPSFLKTPYFQTAVTDRKPQRPVLPRSAKLLIFVPL